MGDQVLDQCLDVARGAAADAGALLLEGQRQGIHVENKGAIDLVTEWDRRAEELVVGRLNGAFPEHLVVAEEGTGQEAGGATPPDAVRWFVDPLDGTTNFAHRLPFFAVSIAMEAQGDLKVGVVNAPGLGLEFYATAGHGAWLNGERISVSSAPDLLHGIVATGFPYDRATAEDNNLHRVAKVLPATQGLRRFGVAALDCALVAWGRMEAYWEIKINPWDVAAGALLVREAGGRVTDLDGSELNMQRGRILATNGLVHDEMLALLAGT